MRTRSVRRRAWLLEFSPELALFIYCATDCLEDMSQSAIVHDAAFDFVDERQNIPVEKQFGDAAGAKRFRPCTPAIIPFPVLFCAFRAALNMETQVRCARR
jgi:hypothetical protein